MPATAGVITINRKNRMAIEYTTLITFGFAETRSKKRKRRVKVLDESNRDFAPDNVFSASELSLRIA